MLQGFLLSTSYHLFDKFPDYSSKLVKLITPNNNAINPRIRPGPDYIGNTINILLRAKVLFGLKTKKKMTNV